METFFLSDLRVQQWLDQLIEKIVAVSQAKEHNQSEYSLEFEKGRQIVEEITGLLTNISSLPPSSVFDPIIHLIEQRLHGQEIVDLTNFNEVMEAMVSEGITFASGKLDIEPQAIPALATTANQNFTKISQITPTLINSNITDNNTIAIPLQQVSSLQFNEKTIQVNSFPVIESDNSSLIPTEATRLAFIIKEIFPDSQVLWNYSLGEYNFLVQVEDLLIYVETLNEGDNIEKEMKKQGWNILVCKKEDLVFPRRFKRAIYRILKNSKIFKN